MGFQIKICGCVVLFSIASTLLCQQYNVMLLGVSLTIILSLVGYFVTVKMIPVMEQYMLKKRIFGMDINKRGTEAGNKEIPQSLGLVSATIFILISLASIVLFRILLSDVRMTQKFAALVSIVFSVLLGFVDDVLDIPWRYKLILPLFGIMPVLAAYNGATYVLLPNFLRAYFGTTLDVGAIYYMYMACLGIFCTNSINIYAGINGLEVGQSIIIACSIMLHNCLEIYMQPSNIPHLEHHMFSIMTLLPYIAVAFALFRFNAFPSRVFVGDTFCYFSGVVFAVTGILGHFSKTLLLMFIPQVLNFVYSIPQLIGIVYCPRHRLPKFNVETGKLEAIKSNMNVVNLALWWRGSMTEERLCNELLVFQCCCSVVALLSRYYLSHLLWS